ncbi:MAG: thermonuclease family protein [Ignavibacteriales bacterium]|nr:thermonuclease family protein [Ignavibacteriales bacterium]
MRGKKIFIFFSLLLTFFGCGGDDQNTLKEENGEFATVEKITDGDTFSVIFNGRKEKIRLIGIDTPESRRNDRSKKQGKEETLDQEEIVAMGKEAKAFIARQIQKGDRVKLEFDVQERDKYGRFLCYVYLEDGRMLNEIMIGEGYAYPLTIAPNVKYESKFRAAFVEARENSRGLWKK